MIFLSFWAAPCAWSCHPSTNSSNNSSREQSSSDRPDFMTVAQKCWCIPEKAGGYSTPHNDLPASLNDIIRSAKVHRSSRVPACGKVAISPSCVHLGHWLTVFTTVIDTWERRHRCRGRRRSECRTRVYRNGFVTLLLRLSEDEELSSSSSSPGKADLFRGHEFVCCGLSRKWGVGTRHSPERIHWVLGHCEDNEKNTKRDRSFYQV